MAPKTEPPHTLLRFLSDFRTGRGEPSEVPDLTFNSLSEYSGMINQFDFTNVDTGAAKTLVDTLGRHASKQAFEVAAGVVDKGLEVASSALGATGQWYGFAAGLLGEKALDWVEKKFEGVMGWAEVDQIHVGEWVAVNKGFQSRRRLFGGDQFDVEVLEEVAAEDRENKMVEKQTLARHIEVGLTQGSPHDGFVQVFNTQTGASQSQRVEDVRRLDDAEQNRLSRDPILGQLLRLLGTPSVSMLGMRPAETTANGASKRVGDKVTFQKYLYTIVDANQSHAQLDSGTGWTATVKWGQLEPAANFSLPTEPAPIAAGDYVWVLGSGESTLYCVQCITGDGRTVRAYHTFTGEWSDLDMRQIRQTAPGTNYKGGIFGRFCEAVVKGDSENIIKFRPGQNEQTTQYCRQADPPVREPTHMPSYTSGEGEALATWKADDMETFFAPPQGDYEWQQQKLREHLDLMDVDDPGQSPDDGTSIQLMIGLGVVGALVIFVVTR